MGEKLIRLKLQKSLRKVILWRRTKGWAWLLTRSLNQKVSIYKDLSLGCVSAMGFEC